jgi:hypothetical protein
MNEVFEVPNGEEKVLLHTCCAPCVGPLMEKMIDSGIKFTLFFIIPISILNKSMSFGKMKIYALLRSII